MTVLEFIDKYNKANSDKVKEQMLRSHIKRTYSPVLEKKYVLSMFIDGCVVDGYIDMVYSKINYTIALIKLYTDLDIDRDSNDKPMNVEIYDSLISNNLVEKICECIGDNEIKELSSMNMLLIQDYNERNTSITSIIKEFIESMQKVLFAINKMELIGDIIGEQ